MKRKMADLPGEEGQPATGHVGLGKSGISEFQKSGSTGMLTTFLLMQSTCQLGQIAPLNSFIFLHKPLHFNVLRISPSNL